MERISRNWAHVSAGCSRIARGTFVVGGLMLMQPVGTAEAYDSAPDTGDPLLPAAAAEPHSTTSSETRLEYPPEIRGYWIPKDMGCSDPEEVFSDVMIFIDKTVVGQYEDVDTLRSVRQISSSPKAWLIESDLSIGGHEPERGSNVFVLTQGQLAIAGDGYSDAYRKCQ